MWFMMNTCVRACTWVCVTTWVFMANVLEHNIIMMTPYINCLSVTSVRVKILFPFNDEHFGDETIVCVWWNFSFYQVMTIVFDCWFLVKPWREGLNCCIITLWNLCWHDYSWNQQHYCGCDQNCPGTNVKERGQNAVNHHIIVINRRRTRRFWLNDKGMHCWHAHL